MKCADCLGTGSDLPMSLPQYVRICPTCGGSGEVRPPYTLFSHPNGEISEHYDRPVR